MIREHPLKQPTRIYTDLGSAEVEGHREAFAGLFDTAKWLSQAGAEVAADIIPDALHNEAAWEKRIPVFFDYLLS